NALISHNEIRYEKSLWSGLGEGEKIKVFTANREYDEAEFVARQLKQAHETYGIPWNRMVVFYRTHALSRVFEDAFYLKHIPYVIMGGISFYQRREIKDVLSILKMVQSDHDFVAFTRSINFPKRGIGDTTLEKLLAGAAEERMSILEYCDKLLEKAPLKTVVRLSAKQREGLASYLQNILTLREIESKSPLHQLVEAAINITDYLAYLQADKDTYEERKSNLASLVAKAAEWQASSEDSSLSAFLEELSLKSSFDESETDRDRVHLMTIHNGKGLEYDTVFLVGLEEDVFPHSRSKDSQHELEEERRLCYVGMTRAKERLFMSHVLERFVWGSLKLHRPSRFLKEIPQEYFSKLRVGPDRSWTR
ncbi:MAG: ATP-dependent helicase, partial [Parachlamydiaceae bacterium]